MKPERFQAIAELFREACRRGPADRSAFLDDACRGDAELRAQVEVLLAADETHPGFLAESRLGEGAARRAVEVFAPDPDAARGHPQTIGNYRIIDVLGEGGMGVVYRAEQTAPMRRTVALKLIKRGMDSERVVARFDAERQALALMDHPSVAQVHDGGMTVDGRPYFVMEYVPGIPITDYCDRERLTTRQRLDLFLHVCRGVQHAHQKGIIHRDLKPSNVLVMTQDDHPIPKIIDFGVAKATAQRLTERTLFTEQGQLIGTPEYMSPEQAEMGRLSIDTRTDVYALGVLLYELLTGTLPFGSKTLREAGFAEIHRIIRESEPPKPSTRLSALHARHETGVSESDAPATDTSTARLRTDRPDPAFTAATIALCRRTDLRMLLRDLRGDLDWIVMKCLEKEAARRYGSANELVADIERHLNHQPVEAGPPSAIYRVRKFVRRNRTLVGAAGSIAAVLVLATIGMSLLAAWALHERDRASVEALNARQAEAEQARLARAESAAREEAEARRAAAERERRKAEAINEFVTTALISSDPYKGGEQGFLVVDAMDQAVDQLDAGQLENDPETETALLLTIAGILNGNARSEEALQLAERALKINQTLHPGDHAEVARSLNHIAGCQEALGQLMNAVGNYKAALGMRRRLFPGDHRDVATSLNNLAACLRSVGRPADALPLYEESLEMRQQLFPGDHPSVAASLSNLATCLQSLGRTAEALPNFEASLEMRYRLWSGDHPAIAIGLNNLARCLKSLDRAEEALPRFEASLAINRRLFSGDHPAVATGLGSVASCLRSLGRHEEALRNYEAALEMRRRLFDGDHPDVARSLNNVAYCLDLMDRMSEALPLFEEALQMNQRLLPGDHPALAASLNNLGYCLKYLNRPAEALPKYEAALEMRQRLFQGDHPRTANSLNNVAACLVALDRPSEALPKYEAALEMYRQVLPEDHSSLLYPVLGRARALQDLGRYADAEAALRDAAEQCERSEPTRRRHWTNVVEQHVQLYDAWHAAEPGAGHDAEAEAWRAMLEEDDRTQDEDDESIESVDS
jgi:serine/threonine protein kinase